MRHVRAASDIGSFYFRVRSRRNEFFHLRFRLFIEIFSLAIVQVLKMIFVESIFVLLTTDFLLTGKIFGFGTLRTCDGCHQTEYITIPSNAQFFSYFDFTLKLNLSHGRLLHQPGARLTQMTYEQSSFQCWMEVLMWLWGGTTHWELVN